MRVGLLGPLEIGDDSRRYLIASAKQRGLIALLALNAGNVVSADRLIEGLWGEAEGGDALNALRHHVSRLRKEIGSTLVTAGVWLSARSRTRSRRCRGLEDHASDKVAAAFRRALALWRGAPLVEFLNHDWAR